MEFREMKRFEATPENFRGEVSQGQTLDLLRAINDIAREEDPAIAEIPEGDSELNLKIDTYYVPGHLDYKLGAFVVSEARYTLTQKNDQLERNWAFTRNEVDVMLHSSLVSSRVGNVGLSQIVAWPKNVPRTLGGLEPYKPEDSRDLKMKAFDVTDGLDYDWNGCPSEMVTSAEIKVENVVDAIVDNIEKNAVFDRGEPFLDSLEREQWLESIRYYRNLKNK